MPHKAKRQNLRDIRQGCPKVCEEIICQHHKSIYRFMVYLTNGASLAADLTQETFASAWANLSCYKGRASLKTWLHRIAYRKFIDSKRRLQQHTVMLDKLKQNSSGSVEPVNPLHRVMADEHLLLLYEAMHKLEISEYMMIVLHYIQGLSFREMGKVLDEPVGTVKWRTSRALKKLKTLLTGRI
ncbi:MAG: RNA polymerase sigma factor [Planctomycetota bacterium]